MRSSAGEGRGLLYGADERAQDAIAASAGLDLGDQLRRESELLAYRAARDFVLALRRIEQVLVVAAQKGRAFDESVTAVTVDVVRTHMIRGLMRAQLETGGQLTFWARR